MIPTPTQVWVVVEPIDMRAGIDGLYLRIQATLGRSPSDGSAYALRNCRRNRTKLLVWDGTCVCCPFRFRVARKQRSLLTVTPCATPGQQRCFACDDHVGA